jgi:hypothetical protein
MLGADLNSTQEEEAEQPKPSQVINNNHEIMANPNEV